MVKDVGVPTIDSNEENGRHEAGVIDIDTTISLTDEQSLFSELASMDKNSTKDIVESRSENVLMPIIGSISGVFHPFMDPYIEFERQKVRIHHIYL